MSTCPEASSLPLDRAAYRLGDALWAPQGTVLLSGTQALVRLLAMQRERDVASGVDSRGFVSGYRGSPLGGVDLALWKAGAELAERGIHFLPGVNEELAATQVLGTQRVEADPQRTATGVFALWYGKGPGVDRAGDALKHGNAAGTSPNGGVLVVAGDDHGCVSSSMPHQSDLALQAFGIPVVAPGSVAEILEFGLYGWALSRYSGAWVGLTALSEVVESTSTVDLDVLNGRVASWRDASAVRALSDHSVPPGGLHYRWPDLPSPQIEERLVAKLDAVAAFAQFNAIDRVLIDCAGAKVGIVTVGKAHFDLMEAFRRLKISPAMLAAAGVRLYKVGLTWPIETTRMLCFVSGLDEVLVVEEKAPVVETQLRDLLYNLPIRPAVLGKRDRDGAALISRIGELRPSRLISIVSDWLRRHFPDSATLGDHGQHVRDFTAPELLSNAADAVRRVPYFCAGCPHNTSTQVPEGSIAGSGIGCHFMATWMDRSTQGLIQMGGEGADWISHALFTATPHVFQNMGDGTYYHSGYLAVRQAVAAKATMTYKILFNDAVAMTGGQPIDGALSVDAIARQLESEGVRRIAVVSDAIGKFRAIHGRFPAGTSFHDRSVLDAVQRELRETPGVTALIYEQTCAAEKRRRRKKGQLDDPPLRLFINQAVCEGCGDCTTQSNCVAVLPEETALGRKRVIDQTACNKDYSCLKGFCPSFVGVRGAIPRRGAGLLDAEHAGWRARIDALPQPAMRSWAGPYDLLVAGVGGTGVVTAGALVTMAAHLEGKCASQLDFMGFAQKGGAVLSFVRLANAPEHLNQARIDTQQADAVLACDLVVGASADALRCVRRDRTRILANVHPIPVPDMLRNPDAQLHRDALLDKLRFAGGEASVETFDAQWVAQSFLGDTTSANIVALGFAWQRGLVPVGLSAILRAIELNGVAVGANQLALGLGRLAAADPDVCTAWLESTTTANPDEGGLQPFLDRAQAQLLAYQDGRWAARYHSSVDAARRCEGRLGGDGRFTLAVARSLLKLMTYKDEYEVARLHTDAAFADAIRQQFDGNPSLEYYMAPPLVGRGAAPRKFRLGPWLGPVLRLLALGKTLRGRWFDPFGHTAERRMERGLIARFESRLQDLLPHLDRDRLELATAIVALPQSMRGFGHIKRANIERTLVRESELLHRFDPSRYPAPDAATKLRGIAVRVACNRSN